MQKLTKIMLVEDDGDIRLIATRSLEKLGGFEVIACSNGQEALDKVLRVQPQLILLDVMMPGLDGLTVLSRLKNMEGAKDIPVVFSTARIQPKQVEEYISSGAIGVISKPFEPATLGNNILEHWNKFQGAQQDTQTSTIATKVDDFKKESLNQLSDKFAQEIPTKIASINQTWDTLHNQSWSDENRHRLYFMVHQFAGSAGSLGYIELSDQLRKIELMLESLEKVKPTSEIDQLEQMMNDLQIISQRKKKDDFISKGLYE